MKINPSADIDYNILKEGIYLYKINDDITTYDIRMKAPNKEQVLTNSALHTIEHIVNTYLETVEFADNIIFFGPMGSRTGFYLLTKYQTLRLTNAATALSIIFRRQKKKQSTF